MQILVTLRYETVVQRAHKKPMEDLVNSELFEQRLHLDSRRHRCGLLLSRMDNVHCQLSRRHYSKRTNQPVFTKNRSLLPVSVWSMCCSISLIVASMLPIRSVNLANNHAADCGWHFDTFRDMRSNS